MPLRADRWQGLGTFAKEARPRDDEKEAKPKQPQLP